MYVGVALPSCSGYTRPVIGLHSQNSEGSPLVPAVSCNRPTLSIARRAARRVFLSRLSSLSKLLSFARKRGEETRCTMWYKSRTTNRAVMGNFTYRSDSTSRHGTPKKPPSFRCRPRRYTLRFLPFCTAVPVTHWPMHFGLDAVHEICRPSRSLSATHFQRSSFCCQPWCASCGLWRAMNGSSIC